MLQKCVPLCFTVAATLAAISVAGCGGGGSSSVPSSGGDVGTVQAFGALTAHVVGNVAPPITISGIGSVVTGVYGASITSLSTAPTSDIGQTSIAFDRNGNVMAISPNGAGTHNITTDLPVYSISSFPTWGNGSLLAFQRYDPAIKKFQIYTITPDGSNEQKVSTGGFDDRTPSLSPNGRFIAFTRTDSNSGLSQIWIMYSNGTQAKRISNLTAADTQPAWSPDSSNIAFIRYTGGHYQLYEMGFQGTSPHVVSTNFSNYDMFSPAFSPDGSKIAFSVKYGSYYNIYATRADGLAVQEITYNTGGSTYNDSAPTFSPDGQQIAFERSVGSGLQSIWAASAIDGSTAHQLTFNPGDNGPNWSPFVPSSLLVGAGGSMGASAGGFLYGQQGTKITSVVTFDATTRSGLSVSNETGVSTTGPNVVFGIASTDHLTSLVYRNGLTNSKVTVIGTGGLGGTTATNAIVSYDANTGLVASVLPYTAAAAAVAGVKTGALKPSIAGNVLTYHAKFIGAWDGAGKNLAPSGAADVQIDGKTGELIAVK